jgi:hypothetical protein
VRRLVHPSGLFGPGRQNAFPALIALQALAGTDSNTHAVLVPRKLFTIQIARSFHLIVLLGFRLPIATMVNRKASIWYEDYLFFISLV